jgi:hypothetical protein
VQQELALVSQQDWAKYLTAFNFGVAGSVAHLGLNPQLGYPEPNSMGLLEDS